MFEQTFKNLDDVLRKEVGCATELDYAEQTSWMLFLKYLDDLEADDRRRVGAITGWEVEDEALAVIRVRWDDNGGTDEFDPWLQALSRLEEEPARQ